MALLVGASGRWRLVLSNSTNVRFVATRWRLERKLVCCCGDNTQVRACSEVHMVMGRDEVGRISRARAADIIGRRNRAVGVVCQSVLLLQGSVPLVIDGGGHTVAHLAPVAAVVLHVWCTMVDV